jgi:hypothetical protein
MTTGRINQVTIVRRGWPTGTVLRAPERLSKLLVGALLRERCAPGSPARLLGQASPPRGKSAFPL